MATQFRLSDREIKALEPRAKTYAKHYGGGFQVRVHPSGRKVCRYRYKSEGKTRYFDLGDYVAGEGMLVDIKKKYEQVYSLHKHQKIDPVAEREAKETEAKIAAGRLREEQLAEENRITFEAAAKLFLQTYKGLRGKQPASRTMKEYSNQLNNQILPLFGEHPIDSLPLDAVMDWLEDMAEIKPVMANRLFATMSVVCRWRVETRGMRQNPFAGVRKPAREESKRRALDYTSRHDRVKDSGELRALWLWLDTINPLHGIALKLVAVTGLRPGQVVSLSWNDIFSDEIVIPVELTKHKKTVHRIPMLPMIQSMIDELRELSLDDELLFPGIQSGRKTGKALHTTTLASIVRENLAIIGIEKFTPHDLRRTCATHCGDLGFSMSEIGLLLDHSQGGVTAIYNRADGAKKKLAMLSAWHHRLTQLLGRELTNNILQFI